VALGQIRWPVIRLPPLNSTTPILMDSPITGATEFQLLTASLKTH